MRDWQDKLAEREDKIKELTKHISDEDLEREVTRRKWEAFNKEKDQMIEQLKRKHGLKP